MKQSEKNRKNKKNINKNIKQCNMKKIDMRYQLSSKVSNTT